MSDKTVRLLIIPASIKHPNDDSWTEDIEGAQKIQSFLNDQFLTQVFNDNEEKKHIIITIKAKEGLTTENSFLYLVRDNTGTYKIETGMISDFGEVLRALLNVSANISKSSLSF